MKQKLIAVLLAVVLCLGCFTGCQAQKKDAVKAETEAPAADPTVTEAAAETAETAAPTDSEPAAPEDPADPKPAPRLAFNDFDSGLISYLLQTELGGENFAVSPLSFRAALALAALGAEGETLDELLAALGYTDRDALIAWYQSVLDGVDDFDAYFNSEYITDRGDAAYQVVNSVWNNEELPGQFRDAYVEAAEQQFRAAVKSAAADQLADAVNQWVKEQTNGLIPELVSDVSEASAILVNALYLKVGWADSFRKLGVDVFTTASGEEVEKEYISSLGKYAYYEDDSCQLVSVNMQGGVRMIFVLGETDGIAEKLSNASVRKVEVTVPMFDVETSLNQSELVNYLESVGCRRMFVEDDAEFDSMFTEPLYVKDIIQKSKVAIDEEGLEAAAATAVAMCGNTAAPNPEEPAIFRADRPFSFYVVNGGDSPELLFWGQIQS